MAKKVKAPLDDDGRVLVIATAGFRYDDVYIRTGECVRMTPLDVADYRALNMCRVLNPEKVA